MLKFSQL